jgi:hypothetical protein
MAEHIEYGVPGGNTLPGAAATSAPLCAAVPADFLGGVDTMRKGPLSFEAAA